MGNPEELTTQHHPYFLDLDRLALRLRLRRLLDLLARRDLERRDRDRRERRDLERRDRPTLGDSLPRRERPLLLEALLDPETTPSTSVLGTTVDDAYSRGTSFLLCASGFFLWLQSRFGCDFFLDFCSCFYLFVALLVNEPHSPVSVLL
ncbi:hypothetical protein Y032_0056g2643 [Ancylostoma ceylanicum]|uniref:Uncharacterized protein n=1 Tax=Ancylostoma ceylanicum TaxID=53326 RepID=A0A016U6M6_9BILA|nr:hypothetical protein Y032_0056g2643 [Ancylostoma ceylanicum]